MKIQEAYVTYEVGMALKRVGFNEWCRLCYTTAIRHNGKDLSFDEELDLKSEGRANEIEYTPGGWCEQHNNRNSEDFISSNQDCCSCPSQQVALRFLREVLNIFVEICIEEDLREETEDVVIAYTFTLYDTRTALSKHSDNEFYRTYEECVDAALLCCLNKRIDKRR